MKSPSRLAWSKESPGRRSLPRRLLVREVRRLLLVALVAALVGAVAPGSAQAETGRSAGAVALVTGKVTVTRLQGTPRPLRLHDTLHWHDVIDTGKGSTARILLDGKTTVTLRELSRVELRGEAVADGVRYVVDLAAGKVRMSVARMLMRPGDQVEVRTRNAVASVRGTDFIVETVERPDPASAFGVLELRRVAHGVRGAATRSDETRVITLSGTVEVTSRLAPPGQAERVSAHEALQVGTRHDPTRLQIEPAALRGLLEGLTPPRPEAIPE